MIAPYVTTLEEDWRDTDRGTLTLDDLDAADIAAIGQAAGVAARELAEGATAERRAAA